MTKVDAAWAWLSVGNRLVIVIIVAIALGIAWMFRFEQLEQPWGGYHRNRITGAVCRIQHECWFGNDGAF